MYVLQHERDKSYIYSMYFTYLLVLYVIVVNGWASEASM